MTHSDWKDAAEKWLSDNNWDYQKYGDRRGDRSAYDTLMNYEIKEYLGDAFQAGAEHACEQLKQQVEVYRDAIKDKDLAYSLMKEACEDFKQQLSDMTWEYENACKFATQFEQQRDKLRIDLEREREANAKLRAIVS